MTGDSNTNPLVERVYGERDVNGTKYYQTSEDSPIWRAQDGSGRMIAGPEELEDANWFYVSEFKDYFREEQLATFVGEIKPDSYIDIDGPGYIEDFMANVRSPIPRLMRQEFKMKKLVDEALGVSDTFEQLYTQYSRYPLRPVCLEDNVYSIDNDARKPGLTKRRSHQRFCEWENGGY